MNFLKMNYMVTSFGNMKPLMCLIVLDAFV